MKTAFVLLAAAGVAMSQGTIPQCGEVCVTNMIDIAQREFGCNSGDVACFCNDARFGYGLRDCSAAVCSAEDAANLVAYGASYCRQGISSVASSVSSALAGASSTGAIGILTSELASASASASSASEASGSGTVTVTATTTLVTSTGSPSDTITSAASSVASSASDAASSVAESASSAASSVASEASSAASSVASEASSAAESATGSGNAAPMMTAFPMAGAAGIAAMLFL